MQHNWHMALIIIANITCAEAVRHNKIDLQRTALPIAPNGVAQNKLKLGAIKCALAGVEFNIKSRSFHSRHQRAFGFIPRCVCACACFGAVRKFYF